MSYILGILAYNIIVSGSFFFFRPFPDSTHPVVVVIVLSTKREYYRERFNLRIKVSYIVQPNEMSLGNSNSPLYSVAEPH